jgi:antirestriction protein ArdC
MTAYDIITDRIIAQLEAGTVPWHQPWQTHGEWPTNLQSGKRYRGINVFLLHCLGYESPYFVTYRQAQKLGGHVKRGERGCPVVFWKILDADEEEQRRCPILRYYTVFNVAQTEGLDVPTIDVTRREHSPIHTAERIATNMPNAPVLKLGHARASYSPPEDVVKMPRPEVFESDEAYYATLFHELTHSTGHSSRLDRKLDSQLAAFGSADYCREELVAEMGASFLCGQAGIVDQQLDQSAAYIAGWLKQFQNDKRLVVTAAAQAQKAADYILGSLEALV